MPELKLNEAQKKKISAYLYELQHELNLTHFDITYDFKLDPDDEAVAKAHFNASYARALITFNDKRMAELFRDGGWERARKTILHEMVHVLLSGIIWIGTERWGSYEAFQKEHESLTSQLTRILAKHL